MLSVIADSLGLTITTIGETRLPELSIRPDYAVDVAGARVGYVELKKPGYGVPETWPNPGKRDLGQWEQYRLLPNVLYSDGQQFARYNFGKIQGNIARLEPGLDGAGSRLHAVGTDFARVMTSFLLWEPEQPRSLDELVRLIAKLCRLLRNDVAAELIREKSGRPDGQTFTELAMDWRQALFPNLTDTQFADQYSQTVTFALLLARVEGVSFQGRSIGEIARLLGKKHSLMGRALTVLTDQPEEDHSVALTTTMRVLSVVDWADFPDNSYAMLYEDFLAEYDPALRRKSGVYYTPAALVSFMTRFVDDILRLRLGRELGFAEKDVIVVDPAMGTGSFLAEVVDTVAVTVAAEEGPGAVAPRLRELSNRLIGFENQAAPYAVAELRIHSLLKKGHRAEIPVRERRFLTDTLDDPDVQLLPLGRMYEAIERSRRGANLVKREEPVMVVIGNPPYGDKAKGTSQWIETPNSSRTSPSLAAFRKPGNGRREYVLSNKYVYMWRWATWKTFDAHPAHPDGVVALVCSAGFSTASGFAGMREYLRRTADEGWIIDLTPEGHQPPMESRFFRGTQQPICVAIFIRRGEPDPDTPARVHHAAVTGSVADKSRELDRLRVDDHSWRDCMHGWGDPLQPAGRGAWSSMPATTDLMPWVAPGVKPNRTWVYAPEEETLQRRWATLVRAPADEKPGLLKETSSTGVDSKVALVPGMVKHSGPISIELGSCPEPRRVAHRSFDRKWVIPDARLHHRPSPSLWLTNSDQQIFVVEQNTQPIGNGPGLVFTSLIPDMDHFMGHHGGRVLPLYRNSTATTPNVTPGLLDFLAGQFGQAVSALDLVAYLAAVTAHSGFVRRFAADLRAPGVRIPLTQRPELWADAVRIGREVIWLHTYGERCADPAAGRRSGFPKMRTGRPAVRVGIPDSEEGMPARMRYAKGTRTLHIGEGEITPVAPEVVAYQVSGMSVVEHWFNYRRKNPSGNRKWPLDRIVATTWTPAMTTELLELLSVLGRCVELESHQEELLNLIAEGPLITIDDLTAAGVLPMPVAARSIPKPSRENDLFTAE
ncbi:MAG TPA: type ISP restriction/modification enzyme [Mycobacterium sp.]|nr:type ISP restriction/modification enzyme [Mycobacterium sp.]